MARCGARWGWSEVAAAPTVTPMSSPEPIADYDPPLACCPLCGGGPVRRHLRDFRGHGIDGCAACGVEFMNPQYSDESLRRFYAGYTCGLHHEGDTSHRRNPEVRRLGKRRTLELIAAHAPGRRILMVGCGDGLELQEALATGWQPEGYDVDPKATAAIAERLQVPVHCGEFHDLLAKTGGYDAIFLDQVIEHPKDPGRYLDTCHALLRPGGVLFLGMPNLGSISNRLKTIADRLHLRSRPARHYNTRHHLTFFRPAVLVRLLRERYGMAVLCVRSSLKPQRNKVAAMFHRLGTVFDSSFLVIARRAAEG